MDALEMRQYVCQALDGTVAVDSSGDTFFMYDPDGDLPAQRQIPFVTIMTRDDDYDSVSNLNRTGVYRLNIGLTKATYAALFGAPRAYDYVAVDVLMPHPTYAGQHWVCVLNPGEATLDTVRTLLVEAHGFAARKYANHRARRQKVN